MSLTFAISFIIVSLAAIIYAWYANLPNIIMFSSMFPSIKTSLLVRFPQLVKFVCTLISVMSFFEALIVLFIVPMIDPSYIPVALIEAGMLLLGGCLGYI